MDKAVTLILLTLVADVAWSAEPPITAVAFSRDGASVVVASQAGLSVRAWPKLVPQSVALMSKLKNINDVVFSHDGKQLAVAGGTPGEEGIVELFSWEKGTLRKRLRLHNDLVYRVDCRKEDGLLATSSLDHTSKIVELQSGNVIKTIVGHSRGLTGVCFLPRGNDLVTSGIDQSVRVWNATTGKPIRTLGNHTQAVRDLVLRPAVLLDKSNLPMVASISDDLSVRLWQPTIGRMVRFARLDVAPLAAAWLPDGSRIVVSCTDGRIRLIDPDTVDVVAELDAVKGWAYCVAVHPNGTSALAGGRNGQLKRVSLPKVTKTNH